MRADNNPDSPHMYLEDHEISMRLLHLESSLIELSMVTNPDHADKYGKHVDAYEVAVIEMCIAHADFVNRIIDNANRIYKSLESVSLKKALEISFSILYSLESIKASPIADSHKHIFIHGLTYIAKDLQEQAFKD